LRSDGEEDSRCGREDTGRQGCKKSVGCDSMETSEKCIGCLLGLSIGRIEDFHPLGLKVALALFPSCACERAECTLVTTRKAPEQKLESPKA
jgi:hypothetical protein